MANEVVVLLMDSVSQLGPGLQQAIVVSSLNQTRLECIPPTEACYVGQVDDRKESNNTPVNQEFRGRNDTAFWMMLRGTHFGFGQ